MASILLHHVAPGLGAVIALGMFATPLKTVLHIRKTQNLGDMNPIPMVAIVANCTSWLIYGCLNKDPYVILANEPGLMLGLFMSVSCYAVACDKIRDQMMKVLMFFAALITATSILIALGLSSHESQSAAAGYLSITVLLCYYSSPLSVVYKVLSTRNSASLFLPLSAMSMLNASLWIAYGLAITDPFIWLPNLAGFILGIIQITLIHVYPSRPECKISSSAMDGGADEEGKGLLNMSEV